MRLRDRMLRTRRVGVALVAAMLLAACTVRAGTSERTALSGARLEVLASWSGTEQQRFVPVLTAFEARTGVSVTYTSARHRVSDELAGRVATGRVPDVVMLPQPGLLRQYAAEGRLVALDRATEEVVGRNYGTTWRRLATVGGRLFGVWFKAANKSLVWYDVAAFERAGVVPPGDVAHLFPVVRALERSGTPPFVVAGKDGWTLTDWFENLYLRQAGPRRYDLLAEHRIPWTDPSVTRTLRLLSALLTPGAMAGGVRGAQRTGFEQSVALAFGDRPRGAMVMEGDFVAGLVTGTTRAELGVDVDVFPFPAWDGGPPLLVGGGDVAVLMRPSRAGAALMRFLATPEAAAVWAAKGGFVSPNLNLDLSVYPDELSRRIARSLLEAGDGFHFDLSDLQPAAFGGSDDRGMRHELQRFLADRDVDATAARLEAEARAAFAGGAG